jgi:tetratricopeptide (TPR) repeat protein
MADKKALYKQAFGAFARGEYAEAIAGYRALAEVDPSFALAYQGLAEAHAKSGDLDAAIDAIQKAMEEEPL